MSKKNMLNIPEVITATPETVDAINEPTTNTSEELVKTLLERVAHLENALSVANAQKESKAAGENRSSQVLEILKTRGPISIKGIAAVLETTTRNVSSVLTAIRSKGTVIHTDNLGQKYIVEATAAATAPTEEV